MIKVTQRVYGNGKYTGDFNQISNLREGFGRFEYKNGHVYEGQWRASKIEGKGKYFFSNGDVFEGEFYNGKREGYGEFKWANGNWYKGEWVGDAKGGKGGEMYWATGDWKGYYYKGAFKKDDFEGWGTSKYEKVTYQGQWKDHKRHGIGWEYDHRSLSAKSTVTVGEWRGGKMDGLFFQFHKKDVHKMIVKDGKELSREKSSWEEYLSQKKAWNVKEADTSLDEFEVTDFSGLQFAVESQRKQGVYTGYFSPSKKTMEEAGILLFKNGDQYVGRFENNAAVGKGTYTFKNKDVFTGTFASFDEAKGELLYSNGDKYIGSLVKKVPQGIGKFFFSEGKKYIGEFKDGKIEGEGKMILSPKESYEGGFKDGKFDGQGCLKGQGGEIFVGSFVEGEKEGLGKQFFADGIIFEGNFENNIRSGKGKMTYPTFGYYDGDWKGDKKEGSGTLEYTQGDYKGFKYVGLFSKGNFHGLGEVFYPSGDRFNGFFQKHQKNGRGTLTIKKSSEIEDGVWEDGKKTGLSFLFSTKDKTVHQVKYEEGKVMSKEKSALVEYQKWVKEHSPALISIDLLLYK